MAYVLQLLSYIATIESFYMSKKMARKFEPYKITNHIVYTIISKLYNYRESWYQFLKILIWSDSYDDSYSRGDWNWKYINFLDENYS